MLMTFTYPNKMKTAITHAIAIEVILAVETHVDVKKVTLAAIISTMVIEACLAEITLEK
jgi:hypothetical protein